MLTALLLPVLLLALAMAPSPPRSVVHTMRTMGTYAQVMVVSSDSLATIEPARSAHRALQRVDSLMSNWTDVSEVARINREAATHAVLVEPQVSRVIATAVLVGRLSEGAFDITVEPLVRAWGFLGGPKRVPSEAEARAAAELIGPRRLAFDPVAHTIRFAKPGVRIDLGGIAKGYAVDCAAESLLAHGVRDALVDVSGNMRALGAPAGAPSWRIGVRDPRDRVPSLGRVSLSGGAIATSGKYEQFVAQDGRTYGHILDPRTGRPAEGLIAVTVLAPSAMLADAWGTALFVLGLDEARRVAASDPGLDAILVEPGASGRDTLWIERSLESVFQLDPAAERFVHVRWF